MKIKQKVISATIYNKETGEKVMDLPTDCMYLAVPSSMNFSTKFPTWIIAYCPDTDSFYVTNERFWFWEYDKEFKTEQDGIDYFEKHINKFVNIANRIKDRVMLRRFVEPSNSPVFLENTNKWYTCKIMHHATE